METYEGTPLMGLYQELVSHREEREDDRRRRAHGARARRTARAASRCACRRCHLSQFVPHATNAPLRRVRSQVSSRSGTLTTTRGTRYCGRLRAAAGLPTIARSNAVLRPSRRTPEPPV